MAHEFSENLITGGGGRMANLLDNDQLPVHRRCQHRDLLTGARVLLGQAETSREIRASPHPRRKLLVRVKPRVKVEENEMPRLLDASGVQVLKAPNGDVMLCVPIKKSLAARFPRGDLGIAITDFKELEIKVPKCLARYDKFRILRDFVIQPVRRRKRISKVRR